MTANDQIPIRRDQLLRAKRKLISPRDDERYLRRDAKDRIVETDDVGRSLAQDPTRSESAKSRAKLQENLSALRARAARDDHGSGEYG